MISKEEFERNIAQYESQINELKRTIETLSTDNSQDQIVTENHLLQTKLQKIEEEFEKLTTQYQTLSQDHQQLLILKEESEKNFKELEFDRERVLEDNQKLSELNFQIETSLSIVFFSFPFQNKNK